MNLAIRSRRLAAAFGTLALVAGASLPAAAQEISDSHLSAARAVLASLHATDEFDFILPGAAQSLKSELIQKNPDLQALIIEIVDQTAFALAARRGDLEREAATIYARAFTEAQLNEISTFYSSETGKKLLTDSPLVTRDVVRAAEIWQNGIARDLAQQVGEELARRAEQAQPQQQPQGGNAEGGEAPQQ
ncbi:MAG: DUF2059 domain-containing protein [Aquamicrobium sp.]|uniref:DUF2059 domain-containing protein n=1 Tax=Aquamicrobium sp. TaxID=1872579 RepID=UPI00349EA78D|nr:DUF2059 domain-containing protein [Aquamicrobium sp.]MCO5159454.1 DUF2059 domain-containing protein [Aquamicrobium sp.]